MLKSDAISHFKTQQALADAIGRRQSTVSEWPEVVPLAAAVLIERVTRKKCRVDYSLYPKVPAHLREVRP